MNLQTEIQMFFQILVLLLEKIITSMGEGENAGFQHFLLYLQCFPKVSLSKVIKTQAYLVKAYAMAKICHKVMKSVDHSAVCTFYASMKFIA